MNSAGSFDSWSPQDFPEFTPSNDPKRLYQEMLRRVAMKPSREYLFALSKECLAYHAILMDPGLLAARSAAQLVVHLAGMLRVDYFHGVPVPVRKGERAKEWIRDQIEDSLRDLTTEDANAIHSGLLQPDPQEPRHQYLTKWFDVDPLGVVSAAVRFNHLPLQTRQCFFHIFMKEEIDKMDLAKVGDEQAIRKQAEIGLRAIIDPKPPGPGY